MAVEFLGREQIWGQWESQWNGDGLGRMTKEGTEEELGDSGYQE